MVLFVEVYLRLYIMSFFIFGKAVLSDMFNKKFKVKIGVNSTSVRTVARLHFVYTCER